jgi:GTP-binding protein EngB required for normal cell division
MSGRRPGPIAADAFPVAELSDDDFRTPGADAERPPFSKSSSMLGPELDRYNEIKEAVARVEWGPDHRQIELPEIVVAGSTSAGKSRLLNFLARVQTEDGEMIDILPTSAKLCTRCPVVLKLTTGRPSVTVKSARATEARTVAPIQAQHEVEKLVGEIVKAEKTRFSETNVFVTCSHPENEPLTLTDLPGFVSGDGAEDKGAVEALVKSHVVRGGAVIVIVSAATMVASNDVSFDVIRTMLDEENVVNPQIVVVHTKLDRLVEEAGAEAGEMLVDKMKSIAEHFPKTKPSHFGIALSDEGIRSGAGITAEAKAKWEAWTKGSGHNIQFGEAGLRQHLGVVLKAAFQSRLPALKEEARARIKEAERIIKSTPPNLEADSDLVSVSH